MWTSPYIKCTQKKCTWATPVNGCKLLFPWVTQVHLLVTLQYFKYNFLVVMLEFPVPFSKPKLVTINNLKLPYSPFCNGQKSQKVNMIFTPSLAKTSPLPKLYSKFRGSIDGVIFPWGKRTFLIFPLHFLTLPLYFYNLSIYLFQWANFAK